MRQLATRKATGIGDQEEERAWKYRSSNSSKSKGNSYTNCKEIKF